MTGPRPDAWLRPPREPGPCITPFTRAYTYLRARRPRFSHRVVMHCPTDHQHARLAVAPFLCQSASPDSWSSGGPAREATALPRKGDDSAGPFAGELVPRA